MFSKWLTVTYFLKYVMRLSSKRTFGFLFFAVVRFSPPSQETEAVKRKAKAKNNSPDPQEPIYNLLVAAKGRSPRPRQVNSWLI